MKPQQLKLNCDLGEQMNPDNNLDADIMPYIDMANIACGFHASNYAHMAFTTKLALQHNVTIGAHPSYPDREGFGRNPMHFSEPEIIHMILYQVGALQAICQAHGSSVAYIKPHGALYNSMMSDDQVFNAVANACLQYNRAVPLMIMSTANNQLYLKKARQIGIKLLFEAFVDRQYSDNGLLVSRSIQGAVFNEICKVTKQAKLLIDKQQVISDTGNTLTIQADSICIHSDTNPQAKEKVKIIRELIDEN